MKAPRPSDVPPGRVRVIDPAAGTDAVVPVASLDPPAPDGACLVAPPLFDLVALPQEPGNEHRETLRGLAEAAALGGVGLVGLLPDVRPVADHDGVIRTLRDGAETGDTGVRFLPHGAVSVGLEHKELSPMGELRAAGVRAVTDGGRPITNTRFLRRAMEYARNFDLPLLIQPVDPHLARGGLAIEGPEATRLGLPAIPDSAERLGVFRAGEIARLTGARVLLFPIITEAGLDALELVRRRGADVSAGTSLAHLVWTIDALAAFDGLHRLDPPLPRAPDQRALADAVRGGALAFLASGHRAVNLSEKRAELPAAEPGMATLPHSWTLLLRIAERHDISLLDLAAAMSTRPAALLGVEPPSGRITLYAHAADTLRRHLRAHEFATNIPRGPDDMVRLTTLPSTPLPLTSE